MLSIFWNVGRLTHPSSSWCAYCARTTCAQLVLGRSPVVRILLDAARLFACSNEVNEQYLTLSRMSESLRRLNFHNRDWNCQAKIDFQTHCYPKILRLKKNMIRCLEFAYETARKMQGAKLPDKKKIKRENPTQFTMIKNRTLPGVYLHSYRYIGNRYT